MYLSLLRRFSTCISIHEQVIPHGRGSICGLRDDWADATYKTGERHLYGIDRVLKRSVPFPRQHFIYPFRQPCDITIVIVRAGDGVYVGGLDEPTLEPSEIVDGFPLAEPTLPRGIVPNEPGDTMGDIGAVARAFVSQMGYVPAALARKAAPVAYVRIRLPLVEFAIVLERAELIPRDPVEWAPGGEVVVVWFAVDPTPETPSVFAAKACQFVEEVLVGMTGAGGGNGYRATQRRDDRHRLWSRRAEQRGLEGHGEAFTDVAVAKMAIGDAVGRGSIHGAVDRDASTLWGGEHVDQGRTSVEICLWERGEMVVEDEGGSRVSITPSPAAFLNKIGH